MPRTKDRERTRPGARVRLLGLLLVGPSLAGCAAISQDVDAYYRQMAFNYKEAGEKAKGETASLENVSRMLLATGDTRSYQRNQRRLERLQSWEARCAKQEERFEKAAVWMETHFDLKKPGVAGTSSPERIDESITRAAEAAPASHSETR